MCPRPSIIILYDPSVIFLSQLSFIFIGMDVSKIEFTYWNQDRARWESRWSTGTASGYQNLPSRVRFKITAAVEGDEEKTFVTETKIWLTKPISII